MPTVLCLQILSFGRENFVDNSTSILPLPRPPPPPSPRGSLAYDMRRHYQPLHSSPPQAASIRALPLHRGRNPSPLLEAHTHGPLRLATRTTRRMRSGRADPLPSPTPPYSAPSTPRASCSNPAVPARRAHLAYPKHDTYFHWCPQHLQCPALSLRLILSMRLPVTTRAPVDGE
ncbi:hypothetical protein B0H13DRAFT_2656432 [Mycena leptocephala]|nr:hypothetical protein B0H13DRAFT_2656432 [Mycena leptocephala]